MNKETKEILCNLLLKLKEYERKQIALILISSTLSDTSQKDAVNLYNTLSK